jgi:hypothetical protein
MKQDEFERLNKLINEMEADAKTKDDRMMIESIRIGAGILDRFVTAVEKIAAQGEEQTIITSDAEWPVAPGGPVT